MNFTDLKYLATQSFKQWRSDRASRLAAALAYYTVFSIPPLLIIATAIAAQIFDRSAVQEQLLNQISGLVGAEGANAIAIILENAGEPTASTIAAAISIVTLLFGASGVFGQLHNALNTVWEVKPKPGRGIWGTVQDRFLSFTMVLGVGFLLLVSLVISSVLAALNEFISNILPGLLILAQIINFAVSFGVIIVLFALIFKIVPDVKIAWRDVWIGAVVTAFLFTIGKWAIGLYLGNSAPGSTYGAAGSLIVLLLWVYYSAQILFLGAEFTQVYANKYGSRIVADESAVPLTPGGSRRQQSPQQAGNVTDTGNTAPEPAVLVARRAPRAAERVAAERPLLALRPAEKRMRAFHRYVVIALAYLVAAWRFLTNLLRFNHA